MTDSRITTEELSSDIESSLDGASRDELELQRDIARDAIARIRELVARGISNAPSIGNDEEVTQESASERDVEAEVRAIKERLGV
jgi:uncharacterized protein YjcR